MKDFFISYNVADRKWAEWIAWQLEEAGYTIAIHDWDTQSGENFIAWMDEQIKTTHKTIALCSEDYFNAKYSKMEWTAALNVEKLLPVRIQNFGIEGILGPISYIDLVGLDLDAAKTELLKKIKFERLKPKKEPDAPRVVQKKPRFPGALPPIWNVPHHRNPNFTGREQVLDKIHKSLTSNKPAALTQAIHGLGGVGKTQLALEYAYRYAAEYEIIWWIHAEDVVTLAADYAGLATPLNLSQKDASDQGVIIEAVHRWLGQNQHWLLIFDNSQRIDDIRHYLPQGSTGHVLITSRSPNWSGFASSLNMTVLDAQESIDFLCKRTKRENRVAAEMLTEVLGRLPLALEQAGAYIEITGRSISDYLNLFQEHQQKILKRGRPSTDYTDTVGTTWELSFQQIKEQSSTAVDLLNLCSFLAPDGIPRDLLTEGIRNLSESTTQPLADPLEFDDAVIALRSYSLIEAKSNMLSVHRLVQAVARDRLQEYEKKKWIEIAIQIVDSIFLYVSHYEIKHWPRCKVLLQHALTVVKHAEMFRVAMKTAANLMTKTGQYLHGRAEYLEAEPLYRKALRIQEELSGGYHPHTARCLQKLAHLLRNQGKYVEAEQFVRRSLEMREAKLGKNHLQVAESLEELAALHHNQGKYVEAASLARRAFEIKRALLGEHHLSVAYSLHILAISLYDLGKYIDADFTIRKAIKIREAQVGKEHPDVSESLNVLAVILKTQGKYTDAEPLFRRAMKIMEQQLGKDDPRVLTSLCNLVELLQVQGKYANTEPLYRRALEIKEKHSGSEHPDTKQMRESLEAVKRMIVTSDDNK